jgi:hypothetical protein
MASGTNRGTNAAGRFGQAALRKTVRASLLLEARYGEGFVVVGVEDGHQLRHL